MNENNVFIDTNIFVYAYIQDSQNYLKRKKSVELIKKYSENIIVSTQVINEFYSVLLKNKISDDDIQKRINEILSYSELTLIDLDIIYFSWEIRKKYFFSLWDGLIVSSALKNNCAILYTEDLQHNQLINGKIQIINPFI